MAEKDTTNHRNTTLPRFLLAHRGSRRSRLQLSDMTQTPLAKAVLILCVSIPFTTVAAVAAVSAHSSGPFTLSGMPTEFIIFGTTLAGVVLFPQHALSLAFSGLAAIVLYKLEFTWFKTGSGLPGLITHMKHEWVMPANLFMLLLGFAVLARHFEHSKLPNLLPAVLPRGWKGGFLLLAIVFVLAGFLDNIAAAMIGGVMARQVFKDKVHIGYLAGIVAASNAGGAGSVIGATTTTMIWLTGISPLAVVDAYVAAGATLLAFGIPAAFQQHRYSPIMTDAPSGISVDWTRAFVVFVIPIAVAVTNIIANICYPALLIHFPVIGLALWVALLATAPLRSPDWRVLSETYKGAIFLVALVTCASFMPVEELASATWQLTLALGFVSAVLDNIPLMALALRQGGYDWGLLAFAVSFGGSMIWFSSTAGVALANMYPEAKSVSRWLMHGWHVPVAYVIGFFFMLALLGWHPDDGGTTTFLKSATPGAEQQSFGLGTSD